MIGFYGILLASGGIDSTILAYKLVSEGKNIIPLFLDYGQHCKDKEFNILMQVMPKKYRDNIVTLNISNI